MQRIENPIPVWTDGRGALIDAGFIYIGVANGDPETDPIDCFLNQGLTQPIDQPLRTLGGRIVSGENAVNVYVAEADYSIRVRDANSQLVLYVPSVAVAAASYQPASAELDLLAALSSTAFGRPLLELPNQAALQAAVGLPASLPLSGGTVTGNIVRSSAGVHPYFADAAMTGGRIYITAPGAADPTSQPGDIWFEAE